MGGLLHWLLHSPTGSAVRIAVGLSVLGVLLAWDLVRHGRASVRWREYLLLAGATAGGAAYGAMNDNVTVTISWEYFFYGKGLMETLGYALPPDAMALRWEATKLGVASSWSAGLLMGVVYVLANNPWRRRPQLPYRQCFWLLTRPLAGAVLVSIAGGLAGYVGLLDGWVSDLDWMDPTGRPLFTAVWGVHLGAYVGGGIGAVVGAVQIIRRRRRLAQTPLPAGLSLYHI